MLYFTLSSNLKESISTGLACIVNLIDNSIVFNWFLYITTEVANKLFVAELLSVGYFAPSDEHCWVFVLPCFVNVNAIANDKDALWQETLLALNNKQFLHLKLLLYLSMFSQPLKRTCTFSLQGSSSEKVIHQARGLAITYIFCYE